MVNVEVLEQELKFITRNPKHHRQGTWFDEVPDNACQTAGCLAGWTAIHHAKDELESKQVVRWLGDKQITFLEYEPKDVSWTRLGMQLLGIEDMDTADELFNGDNTLWDLWNIASMITNGAIQIPEEVQAQRDENCNRGDDGEYDWLADDEYED